MWNKGLSASLTALRVRRSRIVGRLLRGVVRLYGCAEVVVRSPSWVAAFLPCGEDKNPRLIGKRSLRRQAVPCLRPSTAPRIYILPGKKISYKGEEKIFLQPVTKCSQLVAPRHQQGYKTYHASPPVRLMPVTRLPVVHPAFSRRSPALHLSPACLPACRSPADHTKYVIKYVIPNIKGPETLVK